MPDRPSPNGSSPSRAAARATPATPADETALPSAAPSTGARVLAVLSIVVAGVCGGLIGYGIVDLQVNEPGTDGSPVGPAIGAVVGALVAAIGVAVVAVLVLRAMTEWQTIEQRAAAAGTDPRASAGRRRR